MSTVDADTAIPELLARYRDPDRDVSWRARRGIAKLGQAAIPELSFIREHGPGRLRAAALTSLAEIGGEAALSARDVAAIERLIRIKLLDERPRPLAACWLYWIAVPGGDQDGIIRILGLSDPRPATFAMAVEIVDCDAHGCGEDEPGSPFGRVFVTPEVDGWTLVAGVWCDPCDESSADRVFRHCTELSARYGRAQAYYYGAQSDGSAWLVAENGVVVRRFQDTGESDDGQWTLGERLPCELAARAEDVERWGDDTYGASDHALKVAAALSIDPMEMGPDSVMRGIPVIALTPIGVAEGVRPGAYPV